MMAWLMVLGAMASGQPAFADTVAAFEAKQAALARARGVDARGAAALEWLRATRAVLDSVPFEGPSPAQRSWLDAHQDLVVYHEPAGIWIVTSAVAWRTHDENRASAAADDIAWFAVTNGLPGECEGYVPCYLFRLGSLEGTYLARHPQGRHGGEALGRIDEMLAIILDDLLKRADAKDFMKVPDDCAEVVQSARTIRASAARVVHPSTAKVLAGLDRLLARCPALSTSR
jgi:hypothetical protein